MNQVIFSERTRQQLQQVGSANVANVLLKRGFKNAMMLGLKPLFHNQEKLIGPAYTLRFIPAREDIDRMANYLRDDNKHRLAIEQCPSGSVLVIDAFGSVCAASMGDMMAARLQYRGVSGVVTDGGYRDSAAIVAIGLPCFQRQNAPPATPIALHPLSLNEPIGCAGVAIYPGDIVFGDADGVVVIPAHLVDEVAQEALDNVEYERFAALHIARGRSIFEVFPATDASRKAYEQWLAQGQPDLGVCDDF